MKELKYIPGGITIDDHRDFKKHIESTEKTGDWHYDAVGLDLLVSNPSYHEKGVQLRLSISFSKLLNILYQFLYRILGSVGNSPAQETVVD